MKSQEKIIWGENLDSNHMKNGKHKDGRFMDIIWRRVDIGMEDSWILTIIEEVPTVHINVKRELGLSWYYVRLDNDNNQIITIKSKMKTIKQWLSN